jgi:hypothetical protein
MAAESVLGFQQPFSFHAAARDKRLGPRHLSLGQLGEGRAHARAAFGALVRYRVDPRDVPREQAARRLGTALAHFDAIYPNLLARGFPPPDPDTGNFDLAAIDRWMDGRHAHLFGPNSEIQARDARTVVRDRIAKL